MAEALVIMFARDIARNLYPDNTFYKNSIDDTAFINGTKVVLPISGADPTTLKNPSSFPLTVERLDDDSAEYTIDTFATLPTHLKSREELVVNYAKRENLIFRHRQTLQTKIADNFAFKWSPTLAAQIVRTTGAAGSSLAPGATGTRKKIVLADILALRKLFNKQNIPAEGRYLGIPSDMESELFEIAEFRDYDKLGIVGTITKGAIGKIAGFEVFSRSRFGLYDNTATPVPKSIDSATATTDNLAAIAWHKDYVRRAEGSPRAYLNMDRAEWTGGIYNFDVDSGGIIARPTTQVGVAALVQAP